MTVRLSLKRNDPSWGAEAAYLELPDGGGVGSSRVFLSRSTLPSVRIKLPAHESFRLIWKRARRDSAGFRERPCFLMRLGLHMKGITARPLGIIR